MVSAPRPSRALTILATAAATLFLGACASIPQRAWDNGASLGWSSNQQLLYGPQTLQAKRQLYSRTDPLVRMQRSVPFQPFGRW